ncbi:hypothetical protein R1sor_026424 [Riccia sorocarpa]|uniref:Endonuclease/exonuclease/phosphatase domain-containing protein n=1 Tax=Riccia sorocarpa TaxID=122646 RepID=A0ABD3GCU1_9MARC
MLSSPIFHQVDMVEDEVPAPVENPPSSTCSKKDEDKVDDSNSSGDIVFASGGKQLNWKGRGLKKKGKKGRDTAPNRESTVIIDKPIGSRGGTAVIINKEISVTESGVAGSGRLAWAKVKLGGEQVGLVSIHAPNKRNIRTVFWRHLHELIADGNWIITSDYNQVELPEDSRGNLAVVKGREARVWRSFVAETGLIDSFFGAASIEGSRYTRFARRGSRYDFSRLDRVYLSNGAQWVSHIKEVSHLGSKSVSDHIPICIDIQLDDDDSRKTESYFKMNVDDLKCPETRQRVIDAWEEETEVVRDDRRKWMRGWSRVRKVLMQVRKEQAAHRKTEGSLEVEVAVRRQLLNADSSREEVEMLSSLEAQLKDQQLRDAKEWRLRSRERWLSTDDAPSKFFFIKLKAKWAKELMEALEDEEGNVTTDLAVISSGIHKFYQSLYNADPDSEESLRARTEVVNLISKKLESSESQTLSLMPQKDEVERVVFSMRGNRAPGHDGVTIDIV